MTQNVKKSITAKVVDLACAYRQDFTDNEIREINCWFHGFQSLLGYIPRSDNRTLAHLFMMGQNDLETILQHGAKTRAVIMAIREVYDL